MGDPVDLGVRIPCETDVRDCLTPQRVRSASAQIAAIRFARRDNYDAEPTSAHLPQVDASDVDLGGRVLRLALAMRGGVSLAVWIGGAVAELDLLRSLRVYTQVDSGRVLPARWAWFSAAMQPTSRIPGYSSG